MWRGANDKNKLLADCSCAKPFSWAAGKLMSKERLQGEKEDGIAPPTVKLIRFARGNNNTLQCICLLACNAII